MFKDQFYTSSDDLFMLLSIFQLEFGLFIFRSLKNIRYCLFLCWKYFSVSFLLCFDYAKAFFKNDLCQITNLLIVASGF